jgi:hypothetical protein
LAAGFEVVGAPRPDYILWRRPGINEFLSLPEALEIAEAQDEEEGEG